MRNPLSFLWPLNTYVTRALFLSMDTRRAFWASWPKTHHYGNTCYVQMLFKQSYQWGNTDETQANITDWLLFVLLCVYKIMVVGARCYVCTAIDRTNWCSMNVRNISFGSLWGLIRRDILYSCVSSVYLLSFFFVPTEVPNCQSSFWKAEKFYYDNTESKFGLFCDLVFYMAQNFLEFFNSN